MTNMRSDWKSNIQTLVIRNLLYALVSISFGKATVLCFVDNSQLAKKVACARISGRIPLNYYTDFPLQQSNSESIPTSSLQWKTAGKYGLEFLGAAVFATGCLTISGYSVIGGDPEYWNTTTWGMTYTAGNSLITSFGTWGIGRLLGHKGAWWKTAICTGIGGAIGSIPVINRTVYEETNVWTWVFILGPPAFGAVIGLNL